MRLLKEHSAEYLQEVRFLQTLSQHLPGGLKSHCGSIIIIKINDKDEGKIKWSKSKEKRAGRIEAHLRELIYRLIKQLQQSMRIILAGSVAGKRTKTSIKVPA